MPGWPTSMWTIERPCASRARARSITSMTMKGATSERAESGGAMRPSLPEATAGWQGGFGSGRRRDRDPPRLGRSDSGRSDPGRSDPGRSDPGRSEPGPRRPLGRRGKGLGAAARPARRPGVARAAGRPPPPAAGATGRGSPRAQVVDGGCPCGRVLPEPGCGRATPSRAPQERCSRPTPPPRPPGPPRPRPPPRSERRGPRPARRCGRSSARWSSCGTACPRGRPCPSPRRRR